MAYNSDPKSPTGRTYQKAAEPKFDFSWMGPLDTTGVESKYSNELASLPASVPIPATSTPKPTTATATKKVLSEPVVSTATLPEIRPESERRKIGLGKLFEPENYANYVLPALAIIESIATKGKSPGTVALTQADTLKSTLATKEDRKRKDAADRQVAYERQLEKSFKDEVAALDPEKLGEEEYNKKVAAIYKKYRPEEYGKIYADKALEAQFRPEIGGGGMMGGWALRSKEWDAIAGMPEGKEKNAAKISYLYKWSPSTAFTASPEGIDNAFKRARATAEAGQLGKVAGETAAAGGVNPVTSQIVSDLRNEFLARKEIAGVSGLYQNWKKANSAFDDYKSGKASPYEVDQSLGYFASKALDPNSVVMPGEFDRFAKGLGLQSAQALAEQLINGGLKLTDDQRKALVNIVNRGYDSAKEGALPVYNFYRNQSTKKGQDPEDVTGMYDYIFAKPPLPAQPAPGGPAPKQPNKLTDTLDIIKPPQAPVISKQTRARAQAALNDPEATEQDKAAARKILGL